MSSTLGSPTRTGWKRRSSAASFSMYLAYSFSVVAPMQRSSPRASAGLSRLAASTAPSAAPAPTSVCKLVDEQQDPTVGSLHLVEHGLEPVLELAAVLGPGDQRTEVECDHRTVLERFRDVAAGDPPGQPFGDGGLTDAGFADEYRVVLGPAAEHLHGAPDFLVASDDGIELALARGLGEVPGVLLQRFVLGFGILIGHPRGPAHTLQGRKDSVRRGAHLLEDRRRLAVAPCQRQQQVFGRQVVVAEFRRRLLGPVQQFRQVARGTRLCSTADLGDLREAFAGRLAQPRVARRRCVAVPGSRRPRPVRTGSPAGAADGFRGGSFPGPGAGLVAEPHPI